METVNVSIPKEHFIAYTKFNVNKKRDQIIYSGIKEL